MSAAAAARLNKLTRRMCLAGGRPRWVQYPGGRWEFCPWLTVGLSLSPGGYGICLVLKASYNIPLLTRRVC